MFLHKNALQNFMLQYKKFRNTNLHHMKFLCMFFFKGNCTKVTHLTCFSLKKSAMCCIDVFFPSF